jgi:hypothetical protein
VRIAYLFDRPLPATETDSEQVIRTVDALVRRGVHVTLVVPPGAAPVSPMVIADYYKTQHALHVSELPNALSCWSTGRKWLHALAALRHAQSLRPDVIYTRNFPTLFVATALGVPIAYETYRLRCVLHLRRR